MPATVQVLIDNTESKCPGCNYHVVSRYKLDTEADADAACGDCFADWLAQTDATVSFE